jgi:hypothetical protein
MNHAQMLELYPRPLAIESSTCCGEMIRCRRAENACPPEIMIRHGSRQIFRSIKETLVWRCERCNTFLVVRRERDEAESITVLRTFHAREMPDLSIIAD